MKRYIAYFDFLGYKEFILNNDEELIQRRVGHILRDIETALSDEYKVSVKTMNAIADLEHAQVHCLNISDTVIFYSKDETLESFDAIIDVAYRFNWRNNLHNFPVRGILTYDDFRIVTQTYENASGIRYSPNIMYGKGLVTTHLKCDKQEWAGCCIDNSVIEIVNGTNRQALLNERTVQYDIPIKDNEFGVFSKYAFRLYAGNANKENLKNLKGMINEVFNSDNKDTTDKRVQQKINNTINFVDFLKDK